MLPRSLAAVGGGGGGGEDDSAAFAVDWLGWACRKADRNSRDGDDDGGGGRGDGGELGTAVQEKRCNYLIFRVCHSTCHAPGIHACRQAGRDETLALLPSVAPKIATKAFPMASAKVAEVD